MLKMKGCSSISKPQPVVDCKIKCLRVKPKSFHRGPTHNRFVFDIISPGPPLQPHHSFGRFQAIGHHSLDLRPEGRQRMGCGNLCVCACDLKKISSAIILWLLSNSVHPHSSRITFSVTNSPSTSRSFMSWSDRSISHSSMNASSQGQGLHYPEVNRTCSLRIVL